MRRVQVEALERGSDGHMVMLTVPLAGDLWEREAHQEARRQVAALVDGWPAWYKIERGKKGVLHAHILTVSEVVTAQVLARPEVHGVPVWSRRGLLAYLSKPANGQAARSAHRRRVPVLDLWEAAEDYLQARAAAAADGRLRLPVCSGVVNLPPRRRAAVSSLLILAVFGVQMAQKLDAARRYMAALARKRSQRRYVPASGLRVHTRRCCHLYGDSVRFRSKRPALIGHARPPPRKRPGCWSMTPKHPGAAVRRIQVKASRRRNRFQRVTAYHQRGPEEATKKEVPYGLIPYVLTPPQASAPPLQPHAALGHCEIVKSPYNVCIPIKTIAMLKKTETKPHGRDQTSWKCICVSGFRLSALVHKPTCHTVTRSTCLDKLG